MRKGLRTGLSLAALTLLALMSLAGCTTHLALNYPKPLTEPRQAANGESLVVVNFTDSRTDKKLFVAEGTLGLGSVKLAKPNAVGAWAARALAAELTHAGVRAVVVNSVVDAQTPVVVTGTVSKIFTRDYGPAMFMRSEVDFSLVVTNDGKTVFRRTYEGVASRPFFGGPTAARDIEAAMAAALQHGMVRAAPDVIDVAH